MWLSSGSFNVPPTGQVLLNKFSTYSITASSHPPRDAHLLDMTWYAYFSIDHHYISLHKIMVVVTIVHNTYYRCTTALARHVTMYM